MNKGLGFSRIIFYLLFIAGIAFISCSDDLDSNSITDPEPDPSPNIPAEYLVATTLVNPGASNETDYVLSPTAMYATPFFRIDGTLNNSTRENDFGININLANDLPLNTTIDLFNGDHEILTGSTILSDIGFLYILHNGSINISTNNEDYIEGTCYLNYDYSADLWWVIDFDFLIHK